MELRYTSAAIEDLASILDYITRESGSLLIGTRFTNLLRQKCVNLASLSATMGRARPELGDGLRSFSIKGYVIFFRYPGDVLEVVDIFEGHRDFVSQIEGIE